jgi:hypothetical protein
MNDEQFVKKVRQSIIDENSKIYKELFDSNEQDQVSDPYWQEALSLYKNLSAGEKETLLRIMRQVSVDTISNIFALLDGASYLEGQDGLFRLTMENKQEKINGDLQDIFLEIEEDS